MGEKPEINTKISNIIKIFIFLLIVFCIAFILASYLINDEFRSMVDIKILKKEIIENTKNVVEVNTDDNPCLYAYDKYITVFSKNVLTFYDENCSVVSKIDINITDPYITSNGKNLVIAEKNGNKLYVISNMSIAWEKELEGEIYRVDINQNGYINVLLKNSTHKSIVVVYNSESDELFRTYLAKNYAICSKISPNNKYLAIGQVDYTGTVVKSVVQLVSTDLATSDPQNSIVHVYESESGKILNNLAFNSKNEVICMFDSYIQKITESSDEKIYDISKDDIFVDINLKNNFFVVQKETSGLFSYKYQTNIKNTVGKNDNLYILEDGIPKKIKATENFICMNFTNKVIIINEKGWLIKRYTTSNEIQDVLVGDSIIGIVYNNKIEIINI